MTPEVRFLPRPVPKPPRVVGPSSGPTYRPFRPFPGGGSRIPPGARGGSLPLPGRVPTPPTPAGVLGGLVANDLFFPRPVGEPADWDPAGGLDPYGNPIDPQGPGAQNGDRGDDAFRPPGGNQTGGSSQPVSGTFKLTYALITDRGNCVDCDTKLPVNTLTFEENTYTAIKTGFNLSWTFASATLVYGCKAATDTTQKAIATVVIDGEETVLASATDGITATMRPEVYSLAPHWQQRAEFRSLEFEGEDITPSIQPANVMPIPLPTLPGLPVPDRKTPTPQLEPAAMPPSTRPLVVNNTNTSAKPAPSPEVSPVSYPLTSPAWRTPAWTNIPRPGAVAAPALPSTQPQTVPKLDPATGQPLAPTPGPTTPTKPNTHFPVQGLPGVNTGGIRPTNDAISAEVGRIEQKVAAALNELNKIRLGELLEALANLYELLSNLIPEKPIDPDTYLLAGVCEEENDDGEQPVFSRPVAGGSFADATISRLDAMQDLLQAHLGYKTPTCGSSKPALAGEWVTTQWQSEEPSSDSPLRLRKRIRFRSQLSRQYSDLLAHFGDFVWEAGPVCVIHKGAWWGTPQVWARDANEGKRVLRHVAGAAGIDPDQVGQWQISGSRNPRFGRTGKMRLRQLEGYPWITARDGSDMLPMGDVDP